MSRALLRFLCTQSCEWLAPHGLLKIRPLKLFDEKPQSEMRALDNMFGARQLKGLHTRGTRFLRGYSNQLYAFARYYHVGTGASMQLLGSIAMSQGLLLSHLHSL